MAIVGDSELTPILRGLNPWWEKPFTSLPFHRTFFFEALRRLNYPGSDRAVLISGPRRVGKTVALLQLVEWAMSTGWKPEEILYLSLDHALIQVAVDGFRLDQVLRVYRENIAPTGKRLLLLLDEVQYYQDWPTWIKLTVDFKPEIKIVATGSSAVEVVIRSRESAAGRWTKVLAPTLSFHEHLSLVHPPVPELAFQGGPAELALLDRRERMQLLLKTSQLQNLFHDYLMRGGFPESSRYPELVDAQRLIREDVIDRVLKFDMSAVFGVRQLPDVHKLFVYLCLHSGGLVDKKMLSKELGVSAQTVSAYLDYLTSAGLLYHLEPIHQEGKRTLKSRGKAYVADTSLRNAMLMKGKEVLADDQELGLLVETAVHNHIFFSSHNSFTRYGYWRDRNDREVDLVQIFPDGTTLPIEIKYKSETRSADEKNLREFLKVSGAKLGVMVVKRPEEFDVLPAGEAKILKIPAYLLLFLLGQAEYEQARLGAKE